MALLCVRWWLLTRSGELTQKSIHDGACLQQIRQRAEAHAVRVSSGRTTPGSLEVGPCGREEGPTAVRQHEHQLQLTASMRPAQDGQGPAFKGVMVTGDRDAGRKTLEVVVGSVWPFRSIRSRTWT